MANFYQQINNNKIRSGFVLTLFVAFILVAAYFITVSFSFIEYVNAAYPSCQPSNFSNRLFSLI